MLSRLLLFSRGTVVTNSSSQTLSPRHVLQTIISLKPNLKRALHFTRDAQLFSVSKLQVSDLSVRIRNGATILTKRNPKTFVPVRRNGHAVLDINTNIANNVFLYKYERPKYFKYLNGFALFHFLFWLGMSYFLTKQLQTRDPEKSTKEYLIDNFPVALAAVAAVFVGTGAGLLIWAFTSKSVRYVILHKGGKHVTFVTYHPLNKEIRTTVPIDSLKCKTGRLQMKNFLPIKLQGRSLNYILDASGEFVNPTLFDHTVGAMRL